MTNWRSSAVKVDTLTALGRGAGSVRMRMTGFAPESRAIFSAAFRLSERVTRRVWLSRGNYAGGLQTFGAGPQSARVVVDQAGHDENAQLLRRRLLELETEYVS